MVIRMRIDYNDYDEYGDEIVTRHKKAYKPVKSEKVKKSKHKHTYDGCLICYQSPVGAVYTETEYCTECGKLKVNDTMHDWQNGKLWSDTHGNVSIGCKIFCISDPWEKSLKNF